MEPHSSLQSEGGLARDRGRKDTYNSASVVYFTPHLTGSSATYTSASGTAPVTVATAGGTAVTVNIDVLANCRTISPYAFSGNVSGPTNVTDLSLQYARWDGNATSTYNWQLHAYNAYADYYFEDFGASGMSQ